jgi:hypothetical protein
MPRVQNLDSNCDIIPTQGSLCVIIACILLHCGQNYEETFHTINTQATEHEESNLRVPHPQITSLEHSACWKDEESSPEVICEI